MLAFRTGMLSNNVVLTGIRAGALITANVVSLAFCQDLHIFKISIHKKPGMIQYVARICLVFFSLWAHFGNLFMYCEPRVHKIIELFFVVS